MKVLVQYINMCSAVILNRTSYIPELTVPHRSILQTEIREHKNRTDNCRRNVGDSTQVSDRDGGAMRSEQFGAQVVNPGRVPDSVVVCRNLTSGGWEPGM